MSEGSETRLLVQHELCECKGRLSIKIMWM